MGKSEHPELDNPPVERSAKERVKEVTPPDQPLEEPKNDDIPVPPPPKNLIKCGYYVGVTNEGQLRFDITGTAEDIAELLGLHSIAGEKLNSVLDRLQSGKYSYITKELSTLSKKLDFVTGILSQLLEAIPDTETKTAKDKQ